ncbi:MAG: (d)CMP kinase [Candidatus Omnitrophota bacterium]
MARRDKKLIVAIDGPAGSGKSTISKLVAKKLKLLYLDTGAMYRALTLKAMRLGLDLENEKALVKMARSSDVRLQADKRLSKVRVYLDRQDVTREIRTPELTDKIKYIAKVPGVRACMVTAQRAIAAKGGAVLEGRDTTTVVCPGARYKFYLDADLKERAKRRCRELRSLGMRVPLKDVEKDARTRDISDFTRSVGALKRSKDARYINTTKMTVDEVVGTILAAIEG